MTRYGRRLMIVFCLAMPWTALLSIASTEGLRELAHQRPTIDLPAPWIVVAVALVVALQVGLARLWDAVAEDPR
jgi:hypothetical protein